MVYISILIFIILFIMMLDCAIGFKSLNSLKNISPSENYLNPKVSVIIPARNEEKNIKEALHSILCQDYKNLEIIVINDRSTDNTGDILNKMAESDNKLKLITIDNLPAGWLGKNHSLFKGAAAASGEYLLFTDADVVMHTSTVSKAVSYMVSKNIDHIAVAPKMNISGFFLKITVSIFLLLLAIYIRPWSAKNPKTKFAIGIGAFNLVKKDVYEKIGTYKSLAMRPDDDLSFGKRIKQAGFKQEMIIGKDLISVEWYSSLKEMIIGLEKNIYAGFNYNLLMVIFASFSLLILFIFPFLGIFIFGGLSKIFYLLSMLIIFLIVSGSGKILYGWNIAYAFFYPAAVFIFLFIVWDSTIKTIIRGGIKWRDTFYPLKELKK